MQVRGQEQDRQMPLIEAANHDNGLGFDNGADIGNQRNLFLEALNGQLRAVRNAA